MTQQKINARKAEVVSDAIITLYHGGEEVTLQQLATMVTAICDTKQFESVKHMTDEIVFTTRARLHMK